MTSTPGHNAITTPLARLLALPIFAPLVSEKIFDFYARHLNPQLTLRRVITRVTRVDAASIDAINIRMAPNHNWRGFRPGQHVQVFVEIAGVRHCRVYSLSNVPADGDLMITVKRQAGGLVSNWLNDRYKAGDYLEISQAFGELGVPDEPAPAKLLMISAGSGITPLKSLATGLLQSGYSGDLVFLHYGRTQPSLMFVQALKRLATLHSNLRLFYGLTAGHAPQGVLSGRFCAEHLERIAPDAADRYTLVCGPSGLIETVNHLWQEREYPPVLSESFTPFALRDDTNEAKPVKLSFNRTGKVVDGRSNSTLLVQAEAAGLQPASGCRMGICFTCTCRKKEGAVKNGLTGEISAEPNEDIRLCISTPVSDVTLEI